MNQIVKLGDNDNLKICSFKNNDQIIFNNNKKITIINKVIPQSNYKLKIIIARNSDVKIINLYTNDNNKVTRMNVDINVELLKNTKLNFLDLNIIEADVDFKITFNNKEELSKVWYYSSILTSKKNIKNMNLVFAHNAGKSFSDIKTYSICKDKSAHNLKCKSIIKKSSSKTETHQNLRITIFDKEVKASSDPILEINDNDVMASHANTIGMLDPQQLFYLESRGLNKISSRILISMSYFNYIIDNLYNDDLKENIIKQITAMVND